MRIRRQDRGRSEIMVRSVFAGTVRLILQHAADVPRIMPSGLIRPYDLSGIQPHGNDGIAELRRRRGITVAGPEIQDSTVLIDGRRTPNRAARGTIHFLAARGRPSKFGLRQQIALPHARTGSRLVSDDRASKGAAVVFA